jgi:type II secretory pathway pseudopilin PulG
MVVVMAIIAIILTFMTPFIMEPIRNAKINGAIAQAKEIIVACNLVRVTPLTTTRNSVNNQVTSTYGPQYTSWTTVSTLKAKLSSDYHLPLENPFDRPYMFKMTDKTCAVAVELDDRIDGWEGYETELEGSRTRIIVGTPARSIASPAWVQHQKRLLNGESIR